MILYLLLISTDHVVATEGLRPGIEPLSHQLMTDGCGFMNRAALLTLRATMGLESPPSRTHLGLNLLKSVMGLIVSIGSRTRSYCGC